MQYNELKNLPCVFGLGISGISAARYFQRINQDFFVVDSRNNPPSVEAINELSCCKGHIFGNIPSSVLLSASVIVLSPGVSPKDTLLKDAKSAGVKIIGDLEIFAKECRGKIVAITGSNGKSTVTDLAFKAIQSAGKKVQIGGNFGIPVLDFLPENNAEMYVLELSSFQLDTCDSLAPEVAVLLNVSEDHMDRYDSFNEYHRSKLSIYQNAKHIIYNLDDKCTYPTNNVENQKSFSLTEATDYCVKKHEDKNYFYVNDKNIFEASELTVTGEHNWQNVLAVLAILERLEVFLSDEVVTCLKNYSGLAHRFQLVKKHSNIVWINDSKATNVGATVAALMGLDRNHYSPIILIAGGDAKGADLSPLHQVLIEKVDQLIVMGKDADLIAEQFLSEKVTYVKDIESAVVIAKELIQTVEKVTAGAEKQALVLLSPACASLDMFKNFEHRGNAFVKAVEACA